MSELKDSNKAFEHMVDTVPALKALMGEVGDTYRECARIFGTGHSPLCKAINRKGRRPTLDTLVRWASNARDVISDYSRQNSEVADQKNIVR